MAAFASIIMSTFNCYCWTSMTRIEIKIEIKFNQTCYQAVRSSSEPRLIFIQYLPHACDLEGA